jgi:hypothetical protein
LGPAVPFARGQEAGPHFGAIGPDDGIMVLELDGSGFARWGIVKQFAEITRAMHHSLDNH